MYVELATSYTYDIERHGTMIQVKYQEVGLDSRSCGDFFLQHEDKTAPRRVISGQMVCFFTIGKGARWRAVIP